MLWPYETLMEGYKSRLITTDDADSVQFAFLLIRLKLPVGTR